MKRLICILLIVTICLSIVVPCGATTRSDYDERIKAYALEAMQTFRDYYNKYPASFEDSHILALYQYHKMYQSAANAYLAEAVLYHEGLYTIDTYKLLLKGDVELDSILDNVMSKWLHGEVERDEVIKILMIEVDSILTVQNSKN